MLSEEDPVLSSPEDAMTMFDAAHRSDETLDHNRRSLGYFLKVPKTRVREDGKRGPGRAPQITPYLDITPNEFLERARLDVKWAEAKIAGYFLVVKERVKRKEIESDSVHNYRDPIKIFCNMNDVELNWTRLDKILPARRRKPFKGTAPSKAVLRSLCSYPDRRIIPIVTTMTSGGHRVGIWDYLTVKDLFNWSGKENLITRSWSSGKTG